MSLASQVSLFATRVGQEFKNLRASLGTAATRNVPASGNAAATEVVLGNDGRLTNARTPTAHAASHATGGTDPVTPAAIGAAAASHNHTLSQVTDAGTAASRAVPASGDATASQVVLGSDSRLFDARPPTTHTHTGLYTPSYMRRYRANALGIPSANTFTELNLGNANYTAVGSITWDGVSRMTVGEAGLYLLQAACQWASNGTGRRVLSIRKNGLDTIAWDGKPAAAAMSGFSNLVSVTDYLNVGDYVEMRVSQNSGATIDVLGGEFVTWMSVTRQA